MTSSTLSESETQSLLADYQEALSSYSAPASAQIALIKFISRSSGQTVMELREVFSLAADTLVKNSTDIPIASVCKRFLSSAQVEQIIQLQSSSEIEQKDAFVKTLIDEVTRQDQQQRETIAREAKKYFSQDMRVLTIARSRVVLQCLLMAKKTFNISVDVIQGGPDEPGKDMLKALMDANIDARYIPDCAISAVVSAADIIVVGASAVTADGGFINRTGTRTLASIAKENNKPFYVAVESLKFSEVFPLGQSHLELTQKIRGIPIPPDNLPPNATVYSPELEYTPPSYITNLWTDTGVQTPSDVSARLLGWFN